jgi:phosphatidylserine decarboxylase
MNNYIHTAPEYILIIVFLVIGSLWLESKTLGIFTAFLLISLLLFFRGASIAEDAAGAAEDTVMCPCDGKVLDIRCDTNGFVQIAIFLNVHNVHVQYAPLDGVVKSVTHIAGTFEPAYLFSKSMFNERVETELDTAIGDVKVVQIAGMVARRIVPFLKEEQAIAKGQPFGLIKLGSRVDIWMPMRNVEVLVDVGDRVRIGDSLAKIVNKWSKQ